jgi:hypothetical protein
MAHAAWVLDTSEDWWLKLDRARVHNRELALILDEFRARNPYTLDPESTANPNRVAYRLRIHEETPRDAAVVLGDALHNLRSSLDALAYGMAVRRLGGELTEKQAKATAFPCAETPTAFSEWMRDRGRGALFGDREQHALRRCQSFWVRELSDSELTDVDLLVEYRDSFLWSWLNRLTVLHNVDKHRHLNLTAFWPDLLYWGSSEGDPTRWVPSGEGVRDGAILGYMVGPNATTELHHEFVLVILDDPAHRPTDPPYHPNDCGAVVEGFAQEAARTFHRVAILLEHPDALV